MKPRKTGGKSSKTAASKNFEALQCANIPDRFQRAATPLATRAPIG
jgi:hypothetical protein